MSNKKKMIPKDIKHETQSKKSIKIEKDINNERHNTIIDTSANDIFCEKCDNILDISRTPLAGMQYDDNTMTPKTVSSDGDVNYETILKRIEKGEKVSDDDLKLIDIKEMAKHDYYKKMQKKGEIKKQIIEMIEDMGNSDENIQAYMVCRNCAFTKPIKSKLIILTKNPEGVTATHDYVNESSYRNRVHMKTMPRTRDFKCPNKECPTYTQKVLNEAIFFRKSADAYDTIYICTNCLTVKMN
jgi:hypothetical protein